MTDRRRAETGTERRRHFRAQVGASVIVPPGRLAESLLQLATMASVSAHSRMTRDDLMIATMEAEAEALARAAVHQTAYTFIHKPINLDALLDVLATLHRQQSSAALRKPLQDISL